MKYINPGYYNMVNIDEEEDCEEIKIESEPALKGSFTIPLVDFNITDMYYKFDFFLGSKRNFRLYTKIISGFQTDIMVASVDYDASYELYCYNSDEYILPEEIFKTNSFNDFWLHIFKGNFENKKWSGGYFELKINDYSLKDNISDLSQSYSERYESEYIYIIEDEAVKNIIISDDPIDKNEKLIFLPINMINTDMSHNEDGSYSATVEDQYILQQIDAGNLIRQYGKKSEITSLNIAGIPAYKNSDGLSTIIGIEKSNDTIIEYESKALQNSSNTCVIMSIPVESMTIKDLEGKAYGFKVGV